MAARRQRLLKRAAWLLAAFALLGLGGALMLKPGKQRARREALQFPHSPREEEMDRQRRRSTLVLQRPPNAAPDAPRSAAEPGDDRQVRVDPMHVALAGEGIGVVLEAGALKESPLGRMLLACLSPEQSKGLAKWEQELGVHPLEQVERIGIASNGTEEPVLILSGQLGGFDPSAIDPELEFQPYGATARLAEHEGQAVAAWDEQLLVLGTGGAVRSTLARLQGEPRPETENLASEAYGEVYGTLSGLAASQLLPSEFRERFARAAERVSVHVDARDDLLLVADVYGSQPEELQDLARVIGGAFALGRLHAVRSDQPVLADLLDESRVMPSDGSFQIEMALPLSTIAEQLGECARGANASIPK